MCILPACYCSYLLFTTLTVVWFSILFIDCSVSYAGLRDGGNRINSEVQQMFLLNKQICSKKKAVVHPNWSDHSIGHRKDHHLNLKGHSSPMRSLFFERISPELWGLDGQHVMRAWVAPIPLQIRGCEKEVLATYRTLEVHFTES